MNLKKNTENTAAAQESAFWTQTSKQENKKNLIDSNINTN